MIAAAAVPVPSRHKNRAVIPAHRFCVKIEKGVPRELCECDFEYPRSKRREAAETIRKMRRLSICELAGNW
jgi:hypothetical protein